MTYLGLFLFLLTFVLITPPCRAYLGTVGLGVSTFLTAYAPFSYLLLMILISAVIIGFYLLHTWPKRVEPENPMAKYRREAEAVDPEF